MRARGRVRPSKSTSAINMIIGICLVGFGITVSLYGAGAMGIFWTLLAIGMTGYHAFNLFSEHGVAFEVVDFDTPMHPDPSTLVSESTEQRLTKLEDLRGKGLISGTEFEEQRRRILNDI